MLWVNCDELDSNKSELSEDLKSAFFLALLSFGFMRTCPPALTSSKESNFAAYFVVLRSRLGVRVGVTDFLVILEASLLVFLRDLDNDELVPSESSSLTSF